MKSKLIAILLVSCGFLAWRTSPARSQTLPASAPPQSSESVDLSDWQLSVDEETSDTLLAPNSETPQGLELGEQERDAARRNRPSNATNDWENDGDASPTSADVPVAEF